MNLAIVREIRMVSRLLSGYVLYSLIGLEFVRRDFD
jgi:hypothetical protein